MQELKEFWTSLNKFYLTNSAIITAVFLSIVFMFIVQFRVESLQNEISQTETDISSYEDKIQLLEVEWVYLTRPARLRTLASNYLKDNGYTLASQIKDVDRLEKYYMASYEKSDGQGDVPVEQVSF